mgnify:CR=1 FL=1
MSFPYRVTVSRTVQETVREKDQSKNKIDLTPILESGRMRDLLVKRRDALRRALAGDLSLLKSLSDQTGGDERGMHRPSRHRLERDRADELLRRAREHHVHLGPPPRPGAPLGGSRRSWRWRSGCGAAGWASSWPPGPPIG